MANSIDLLSRVDTKEAKRQVKQRWPRKEIYLGILAIILTVALSVALILYKDRIISISNIAGYSLLGVLVIAFLAGSFLSAMAVPVPYWLLVVALPTVLAPKWGLLAPVIVGLTSALGATLGHLPTFLIGYGGRTVSQRVSSRFNSRIYGRVVRWAQEHGKWAVFLMSAIINPVHLPMTIAMGALRYPPLKFLFYSFLGNSVKSLSLAFAGYYGLSSLLRFLGL
ncbi:MAG: VTT domain-containing protein [Chloroflexi bacterium]|nr:VTT domain-containing protein [Chloroflexota bacterium]